MENKSIKILIIEDNPADIRLIREMLIEAGNSFHMESADSLSKGLQQIIDSAPDVVLLDLSLPDSQGLDTFHEIYAQIPSLPVIILTGLDDKSIAIKAVFDGAQDYLEKGEVSGNLLARSIRYAIERKKSEAQIARKNRVLNAINRIFEEALTCNDKEELGKTCLAVAEELTGSRFGFFDVLNQNGQFITLAITTPEGDTCRVSSSDDGEHFPCVSVHRVDRSRIRNGNSIIINGEDAISAHSDYINIPKGHPKLTSFLGVPLRGNGIIIGMIALANKKGGYNTEDQENIEALSVAIAEAFQSKLDEEKYRIVSERLSLATMAANIGIWDWDVRSNKLNWDNQMCLQHGAMYREFTGTFEEWSASLHPDDRVRILNEMQRSLNEQRELRTEFRILCPDSSERNIYTAVRVFTDNTGKTSRMIGVHLDITEQKAAEAELKKHKECLQEMVEERTLELQKEIRERIKTQEELQQKMDQMERFTRLAVGRETQMIRLKEEVNGLKMKLGESDKYKIVQ